MGKKISKAIILAAGRGSRLQKILKGEPKPLLKIHKHSLLEILINDLKYLKVNNIVIITGFKSKKIRDKIKNKAKYNFYSNYKNTNNLHTLLHSKKELNQSLLCLFSDVVFDKKILKKLLGAKQDIVLAIDKKSRLTNTMRVKIKNSCISAIGNHIKTKKCDGNFIGFAKFSLKGSKIIKKELEKYKNSNFNDYYTYIFNDLAKKKCINYVDVSKLKWKEIDTEGDYIKAKKLYNRILKDNLNEYKKKSL